MWFASYLGDRCQFVKIGSTLSELSKLIYGVPQGSVLGPLLFSLYTTPLTKIIHLPTFNLTCLPVVVPIVPGVVTQIVNILLFLLSAHQSLSLSNILITALPLMLLESGMNSLMMCAVQHQLPPSERSLRLICMQKPIRHSLPCHPVSPWYDLAISPD